MPKRKSPANTYWRGDVLWGRLKVKGRKHRWSLRTSDPAVAASRVKAERTRLIAATHYGDDRKLFADILVEWAAHIAESGDIGPNTMKRYSSSLDQMAPWLDGKYLDEVDKGLVKTIITQRRAAGVTNATIKRDLTALSSVLGYCEDEDYRDDNPALDRQRRVTERRDPIVLPDPRDIRYVMGRCPGLMAALVEAAWKTGCRQSELAFAKRARFDAAARQLTVIGKRNKLRVIDVGWGDCDELLRAVPVALGSPWLFWHHKGSPYRNLSSRFSAVVRGAQKAAQAERAKNPGRPAFRPFVFHHLRHRHAVDYLKAGGNIYDLQQRLGHESIQTTEGYLKYLTPDEQRRAKHQGAQTGAQVQRFRA